MVGDSEPTLAVKFKVTEGFTGSLEVIVTLLCTFPIACEELKVTSKSTDSPGAKTLLFKGAEVHPQEGATLVILKVSSPRFLIW